MSIDPMQDDLDYDPYKDCRPLEDTQVVSDRLLNVSRMVDILYDQNVELEAKVKDLQGQLDHLVKMKLFKN